MTRSEPKSFGLRIATLVSVACVLGVGALIVAGSGGGTAAYPGSNGKLAYAFEDSMQSSIYSVSPDGSSPAQLTGGPDDSGPAYSPDGTRIAFEREGGIEVMAADGSATSQLVAGQTSTSREPTEYEENYVDPESKEVIPVVTKETVKRTYVSYGHPSFSPDSLRLAVSRSSGVERETSICSVYAKNEPRCIVNEGGELGIEPYSRHEEACEGCVADIVAIDARNGTLEEQITAPSTSRTDFDPTYSAGGAVAFDRVEPTGTNSTKTDSRIFLVPAAGKAEVQLTSGPADYLPDFSPDGSTIVFDHGVGELGFVPAAGGAVTTRAIPAEPSATVRGEGPVFSPDGLRIALSRTETSSSRSSTSLIVIPTEGSGFTEVAEGGRDPSWQPLASPQPPGPEPQPEPSGPKPSTPSTPAPSDSTPPPNSPPAPSPAPATPAPSVTVSYSPNHPHSPDPAGGPRWTFRFGDAAPGTTFLCRMDKGSFGPCSSPKVYRGLKRGRHVFEVKSVSATGVESAVQKVVFQAGTRRSSPTG